MLRYKRNIVFLATLHIMVLLFPLLVKELHHHDYAQHHNSTLHIRYFTTHENTCNICSFDYLPFISSEVKKIIISRVIFFIFVAPINSEITTSFFNISLLRGPPTS